MINQASCWFELVELPVVKINRAGSDRKTQQRAGRTDSKTQEAIGQTKEVYFDKSDLVVFYPLPFTLFGPG